MFAYKIAETQMNIQSDNKYLMNRLKSFRQDVYESPDLSVEIYRCNYIKEPSGILTVDDHVKWLRKNKPEYGFHVYRMDESREHVMAHLDVDESWSYAKIKCLQFEWEPSAVIEEVKDWMEFYSFLLLGIVFRNHLLNRNGVVIHSSSIAWNGKGILFTAPSGTGKSTHVHLWEQFKGDSVTVVNDDTPAVRFLEGMPMLCGTPWSGSSDKFANLKVPLEAIIVLEQAPENTIRRLSPIEALSKVMPRSFLPYFDENLMEKAYGILDKLIQTVPIYQLCCRPDREAMELVYQCVK